MVKLFLFSLLFIQIKTASKRLSRGWSARVADTCVSAHNQGPFLQYYNFILLAQGILGRAWIYVGVRPGKSMHAWLWRASCLLFAQYPIDQEFRGPNIHIKLGFRIITQQLWFGTKERRRERNNHKFILTETSGIVLRRYKDTSNDRLG